MTDIEHALADRVTALEREVAQLRASLGVADEPSELTSGASRFVPVPSAACLNTSPCLHTSAAERIAAACMNRVWSGRWALDPQVEASRAILSKDATARDRQRFTSAADEPCEPARPSLLSPLTHVRGRVTDASELHASQRLQGLQQTLWLMIGTSVDHLILRDLCAEYGATHLFSIAKPTRLHPTPGMHFDYCRLPPPLSLTMVYLGYKGLTSLEVQANETLQTQRFAEIQAHLRLTLGDNASSTPDFVSLGGVEWDFKQWGLQHKQPESAADWSSIRASLQMQLRHVRRAWPRLRARFLRTQFRTSYYWYRGWIDVDGAEYAKYNALMHGLRSGGCGGVHILDIARMLNCSHTHASTNGTGQVHGACGRETGWTVDGMHPKGWVMREYFGMALNVLADFGEGCDKSAQSRPADRSV